MGKIKDILAVCAVIALSSCSGKPAAVSVTTVSDTAAVTTAAQSSEVTEKMSEKAETTAEIPSIHESFTESDMTAKKRGSSVLSVIDDEAASDKKALLISGRKDAWNGADYKAELFRGNEIDVKGSFRSGNKAVRVSIQYNVQGNTLYNMIFTVSTKDGSYTSGSGKYMIPKNASSIIVYIESDELGDIYADDLSVEVCGDYTYYPEAVETEYVDTSDYPSLKDAYSGLFRIGTAVSEKQLKTSEFTELIKAQFSSITAGNEMKPDFLLDKGTSLSDLEKYGDAPAVKFGHLRIGLDFAKENGITVRGHTLVWHSQTPEWLFYKDYDINGELADRELMLKRMENYIRSVMEWTTENYPGLISAWDVVNEAADDNGGMRESLWYKTVGEDYIQKAFEFARKYAPKDAKLFYNDYNSYQKRKQDDIISFLLPVVQAGNIDGVGMQSHIGTYTSISEFMNALQRYHDELGVEIQITELDIAADRSDNWEEKQGEYFGKFMSEIVRLRKEGVPITSVTLWGMTDDLSWKASDSPPLTL